MALTMTLVSLASAAACCSESLTSRLAGTSGWTARMSSAERGAVLGGDRDAVEAASLVQQRLGGGQVPDRDRGAAERVEPSEGGDAGHLVAVLGAERCHGDRVADAEVLRGGRVGVEGDLLGPFGPLAGLELERAELRQRRVVAESELGCAAGADGLAVAAEDLGPVGRDRRDRAAGRLDLGQRPHLREQRLGNGRGPALGALDDLLAGDHRVGLLIRRAEDGCRIPSGSCR